MRRTKHILSYAIPIVILLFFLFGSFFAPHDPTATNIRDKYLSSSAEYPFGTDDFGRCEFSRILEGGKTTLGIVLVGSSHCHCAWYLFWHPTGKDRASQEHSCREYFERGYSDPAGGLSNYLYWYLGEQYPHHAGGSNSIADPSHD